MKKSFIFCLLALFVQISMAQKNKGTSMNDITRMMVPLDTVEVKIDNQIYQVIRLTGGATTVQNKNAIYLDKTLDDSMEGEYPSIQMENEEGFYQAFYDNISVYTDPTSLLSQAPMSIILTSDLKGKIIDVVFLYMSDIDIPLPDLAKLEKYLQKECRLNFKITPLIKDDPFILYSFLLSKDKLPK